MDGSERGEEPHYLRRVTVAFGISWLMEPLERIMAATTFRCDYHRRRGEYWDQRFHDRMPVIFDWRDAEAWLRGETPVELLHSPPEDALQEWIVSTRVNKAGVGDDDPTFIKAIGNA